MKDDRRSARVAPQGTTFLVDQVDDLVGSGSDVAESMTFADDPCAQGSHRQWRRELSSESSRLSSRIEPGPRAWRGSMGSGMPTGR